MGWREVFKLTQVTEKGENGKEEVLESEQVSQFSHFPQLDDPFLELKELFQERSSIREFDGNQSKVEAELGALEELLPYLDDKGSLHLSPSAPVKYRYWDKGGQSLETTLRELGASEETFRRYVQRKEGGIPKPKREEDL